MKTLIKVVLLLLAALLCAMVLPHVSGALDVLIGMGRNVFIAVGLAYVCHPLVKFLRKKGLSQGLASAITLVLFFSIFVIVALLVLPLIYQQILKAIDLIMNSSSSIEWIKKNPDTKKIFDFVLPYVENFGQSALNYIAESTQHFIARSTKFIGDAVIIIFLFIYLTVDSQRLIDKTKAKLQFGTKRYNYFKELDTEFTKYLKGLIIIIGITIVEYSIVYYFVGHPDWKTLAALCAFGTLIPYFGGILVNLVALLTAVFVSPELFFKVLALTLILPNIEGHIINPLVHKKTIKISPIVLLPSLFIFSSLLGFMGIILTIPLIITIKITRKYYKDDIFNFFKKVWNT
ncbi:MAG: AI-2E family transporter [Erysipelotrichales bacterium]